MPENINLKMNTKNLWMLALLAVLVSVIGIVLISSRTKAPEEKSKIEGPTVTTEEPIVTKSIEFRFAKYAIEEKEKEDFIQMALPIGTNIFVSKKVELNENDIQEIKAERDPYGFIRVNFKLKRNYWEKLEQVTKKYINENLAILVDGRILSSAVIKEPITGGEISIVAVNDEQAKSLLVNLDLSLGVEKETKELIEELEIKQKNINDISVVRKTKTFIKELEPIVIFETSIIKGDKWRTETWTEEYDGKYRQITFYDGENIWMGSPLMRMIKIAEKEESSFLASYWNYNPERLKVLINILKEESQFLGKEKTDDKIAYKIEVKELGIMWFDEKATLLKIQGEESSALFSDFRSEEGYGEFPYKVEYYSSDGKLSQIREVIDIKINQSISDELFDPQKVDAEMQKEAQKFEF